MYKVEFTKGAVRQIKKLPVQDIPKIVAKAESLAENPRPFDCTKLTDKDNLWRVRVGNYRIIYQIKDEKLVVTVIRVGHRRDVY